MISKFAAAALAACFLFAAGTGPVAASETSAVKQTVRTWLDRANKGDAAGLFALLTEDGSIIDEFAPFGWDSFKTWGNDYGTDNTQNGVVPKATTILKFDHVNIDGANAYAVAAVTYSYKQRDKTKIEHGTEVFTLEKHEKGWLINSFSWLSKGGVDQGADAMAIIGAAQRFASMKPDSAPPPTAIVDEFAPYHWHGASANADWFAALQQFSAKEGIAYTGIELAAPAHLNISGDTGYAVFPTTITYTLHGKPGSEHGNFAFTLEKSAGAWHIASWVWAKR